MLAWNKCDNINKQHSTTDLDSIIAFIYGLNRNRRRPRTSFGEVGNKHFRSFHIFKNWDAVLNSFCLFNKMYVIRVDWSLFLVFLFSERQYSVT